MQYKVPQNVQREDTILWFITLRQLIILMAGGGFSYFLFTNLSKNYALNHAETVLIWIPAFLSVLFAFLKIKRIPLIKFCLLIIEQKLFRARYRFWSQSGNVTVSLTTTCRAKKKTTKTLAPKIVDSTKINTLADNIDRWSYKSAS